jgi:YD repeat-containing protein
VLHPQLTKIRVPDRATSGTADFREIGLLYDEMVRVTKVDLPAGEYSPTFQYDVNSQVTRVRDGLYGTAVGSDTVEDWCFAYDRDGGLTRELLRGDNGGTPYPFGERSVEFDKAGRRTKLAFKSENRTGYLNLDTSQTYSYDSAKHRLTQIQRGSSAAEKAQYFYDDTNEHVTKMAYGNGARAEYGYDVSGALTDIDHYTSGGLLFYSMAYQYCPAGNVTKVVLDDQLTSCGDATLLYEYDDVYRLTKEQCVAAEGSARPPYAMEYGYDAVGNRTQFRRTDQWYPNGNTYTYDYSPRNELTKESDAGNGYSWQFDYDLRGNLTKKSYSRSDNIVWTYGWSSDDALTTVTYSLGGVVQRQVAFKYDALGRRVAKKVDGGAWRWYAYDGLQVIAEGTGTSDRICYTNSPAAIGGIVCRDAHGRF